MLHRSSKAGRGSWPTLVVFASLLAIGAGGCGGATPAPEAPKSSAPRAATPLPASLEPGKLARSAVDNVVLRNGPPWILQRVPIEEVVNDGKFVGWRVMAMPSEWSHVDLKPGDVVTKVNGMSLERPEDLWMAWTSLVVASDLRIAYERGGAAREVAYHIEGEPAKEVPASLQNDAPPPPKPRGDALKKGTVVIIGDDSPPGEDGY
jgi:hypothetical protein